MIVRTYGRRNRSFPRGSSDVVSDGFGESLSQEGSQDIYSFAFSPQDSSHWSFDSEPYGSNSSQEGRELAVLPPRKHRVGGDSGDGNRDFRNLKKTKKISEKARSKGEKSVSVLGTATLMETQEFGEMMEHVDEVNFALDGLRRGQQARIRRASLLSLLSICGTAHQRRLLRTHGYLKF